MSMYAEDPEIRAALTTIGHAGTAIVEALKTVIRAYGTATNVVLEGYLAGLWDREEPEPETPPGEVEHPVEHPDVLRGSRF
jgi:hypothetical protein